MTAGTDVCEISKGEIENKCDVVDADCNGSTKLTDANVNGDSDSSYDFVDEVTLDPVESSVNVDNNCKSSLTTNDVEIQVEENGRNVDCCLVETDCIVVGKSNGGEVVDDVDRSHYVVKEEVNESAVMEVVEPVRAVCQVTDDEVVELDSSPKAIESEDFQVAVVEAIESVVEPSKAESGFGADEVRAPAVEAASVVEEPAIETFETPSVVEAQEVREPVVKASEIPSVVEVQEVREPVVESFEASSVVEVQEVREPVAEASEAGSVVEVHDVREPVVEAYEAESVVETLEVREPATEPSEAGGAMAMPEAESNLELVESQVSDKNVILEADGSELPEVNEVGEMKSEGPPELINGQVEVSEEFHLASRSVVEYEKKLEEVNKTEIDNQESPVLFTSKVQIELRPENEAADIAVHGTSTLETEVAGGSALNDNQASGTEHVARSINQSQMGTQLGKDFKDDQVLSSTDHVSPESEEPLEAETVVDLAFNEDQVSKPEDVSKLVLENQKYTQLNVDHGDSQVLSSADLVISKTENETEVPLEVETVVDPASQEIKDSEAEVVRECANESLNDFQLNEGPQDAQILPSMECVGSQTKNESGVPPETDCASDPTPNENQTSQIEEGSKCIDESRKDTHLNKDPEVAQSLPSAICLRSETVNETDLPLETKTYSKIVLNEKAQIFPSSHCLISQSENGDVAVENGGSFCTGPNDSRLLDKEVGDGDSPITENVLTSSTDYSSHGAEIESHDDKNGKDGICCAPNHSKSEIEVENGAGGGDSISAHPEKLVCPEIGVAFGSIDPHQKAPTLWCDDVELEVPNGDAGPTNGSAPGYHVNNSHQIESLPDSKLEFKAKHSSSISSSDLPSNGVVNPTYEILAGSVGGMEAVLNTSEKVEDDLSGDEVTFEKAACLENVIIDGVQSDGMPTTLPESSICDGTDGQDGDAKVITRPFHFLIKIPRYEDDKLMEKIRHAQLQVDEKTQQRDAIRAEIRNIRTNCQAHGERFEAAKAEERTARRSVKLKRQEIDSLQSVINRVKNAISVEEIDKRIYGMEHMIQHETLPLKEEKEFIREIKRLKHLREQLSSNMGSQDEVQLALDQKDQNEEHLKKLKKELETLKDTVLKAEAVKFSAGEKFDEESKRARELQVQFKAANDIRQEAYEHLSKLRGQLNEKHKNFRVYKDDAAAAIGYASRGDKEALHGLCVEQVEQLMGLWNTDDEFRKEYVRCNMRSTVRRLRTLDGRSLGPDEEPPVLPAYVNERVGRRLISVPSQAKSVTVVANVEQNKQVSSAEEKQAGQKIIEEVAGQIPTVITLETAKPIVLSGSATVSSRDIKVEEDRKEEEVKIQQSEEELELARKAEELRKAEDAAKLKEQRRLEEKAKAKEALERKKKIAEKAEMRAKLRAQKEAEEREKEREKRMRKKEKKKWGPGDIVHDNNSNGEDSATSGITAVAKELSEVKESNSNGSSTGITKKAPQKGWFGKQNSKPKPIPPPLRNRNRRRMQQYLWMFCVVVAILALFLLGNTGFFLNLKHRKGAGTF